MPNIKPKSLDDSRTFYVDLVGFKVAMDMGFIVTLVLDTNPNAETSSFASTIRNMLNDAGFGSTNWDLDACPFSGGAGTVGAGICGSIVSD